jgi:hypothetical protein
MTDKKSCNVCASLLEDIFSKSVKAGKKALLILGIRRNDDEIFILEGEVKVEKQRRSK